jgi:hypothetical protein
VGLPASIKHSPATNKITEVYLGERKKTSLEVDLSSHSVLYEMMKFRE